MATVNLAAPAVLGFEGQPFNLVFWSEAKSPVLSLRGPVAIVVDPDVDSGRVRADPTSPRVLAEGQVPASVTRIYLCPAGKVAVITMANFVNVSNPSTPELVVLYFRRSVRRVLAQSLLEETGWRYQFLEDPLELESGDSLEVESTHAGSVDYVITGLLTNAGGGP